MTVHNSCPDATSIWRRKDLGSTRNDIDAFYPAPRHLPRLQRIESLRTRVPPLLSGSTFAWESILQTSERKPMQTTDLPVTKQD